MSVWLCVRLWATVGWKHGPLHTCTQVLFCKMWALSTVPGRVRVCRALQSCQVELVWRRRSIVCVCVCVCVCPCWCACACVVYAELLAISVGSGRCGVCVCVCWCQAGLPPPLLTHGQVPVAFTSSSPRSRRADTRIGLPLYLAVWVKLPPPRVRHRSKFPWRSPVPHPGGGYQPPRWYWFAPVSGCVGEVAAPSGETQVQVPVAFTSSSPRRWLSAAALVLVCSCIWLCG